MSQAFDTPGTRLLSQAMALLAVEGIRIEAPGDGQTVEETVADWKTEYASGVSCDAIALTGPIAANHTGLLLVRERKRPT